MRPPSTPGEAEQVHSLKGGSTADSEHRAPARLAVRFGRLKPVGDDRSHTVIGQR
jgi:hypothetical protein